MTAKKDVAVKEETALQAAVSPGLPEGLGSDVTSNELLIPRAKLLQALSPEIVDGVEGLKPGMIVSNITQEVLPAEFSPFFFFKVWTKFNPRQTDNPHFDKNLEPGAFIWSSFDQNDPRVLEGEKFGENNERPAVTKSLCFMAKFASYDMPVIVGFSNTSLKSGKKLLTQLRFSQANAAIWTKRFKLTGRKEQSKGFNYFVLDVTPAGLTPVEELPVCAEWFRMYSPKARDVSFEDEGAAHQGESTRPY